jgi:hypothetical protein
MMLKIALVAAIAVIPVSAHAQWWVPTATNGCIPLTDMGHILGSVFHTSIYATTPDSLALALRLQTPFTVTETDIPAGITREQAAERGMPPSSADPEKDLKISYRGKAIVGVGAFDSRDACQATAEAMKIFSAKKSAVGPTGVQTQWSAGVTDPEHLAAYSLEASAIASIYKSSYSINVAGLTLHCYIPLSSGTDPRPEARLTLGYSIPAPWRPIGNRITSHGRFPVSLLLRVDGRTTIESKAEGNPVFDEFDVYLKGHDITPVVEAIREARKGIFVRIQRGKYRLASSIGVKNARQAMDTLIKSCKLK